MKTRSLLVAIGIFASLSALGTARPLTSGLAPLAPFAAAQPALIQGDSLALLAPLPVGQTPVQLGDAVYFRILSKAGISTTGTTSISGNIGVSPISSTAITGFGLVLDASNQYSTSSLVTGRILAPDYAPRTRRFLTSAVNDMEAAYTDAAGRSLPDFTELGAGNIGGMTLAPGLYKWGTGLTIPAVGVTLSGSATDVWIFQIAQNLSVRNGATITLTGGAQASRVFWQVAGETTIGTTADFYGIILCQTQIVMNTGATIHGRALAQTGVTLDANMFFSH